MFSNVTSSCPFLPQNSLLYSLYICYKCIKLFSKFSDYVILLWKCGEVIVRFYAPKRDTWVITWLTSAPVYLRRSCCPPRGPPPFPLFPSCRCHRCPGRVGPRCWSSSNAAHTCRSRWSPRRRRSAQDTGTHPAMRPADPASRGSTPRSPSRPSPLTWSKVPRGPSGTPQSACCRCYGFIEA